MGGGAYVGGALPLGASAWCSGNKVVQDLNDLFDPQDPLSSPQYQAAKTQSLAAFQTAGNWKDLLAAYSKAYDAAGMTLCAGWASYLEALGTLSSSGNGGDAVTTSSTATSSAVLSFGSVPDCMAVGLNVSDSSTPGAITGGQTVSGFTATTVTLTANVNATVNSGDTIVFALPGGLGPSNIQAIAKARYDGLTNNVKMKTFKHGPHDPHSSGHKVKVTRETDGSITISSPFIAPGTARRNRNRNP
jgi:outer membrane lipoprotein SlyB